MESVTESSHSKDLIQCCDCGCHSSPPPSTTRRNDDEYSNPKVHIQNECELLRQTVTTQQQSIHDLYEELEKERNAASSAADESMNVMQRLQHEKAEIQMEFRQYKVYAGEKMEHDLQEILALEEMVNQREERIMALECSEAQGYKHRMMSYVVKDMSLVNPCVVDDDYEFEYPSLKCKDRMDADDVFVESETKKVEHVSYTTENDNGGSGSLDIGDDEMSDRVYTIDSGHHSGVTEKRLGGEASDGDVVFSPREQMEHGDPDITKLYMRLQALEADRESMKQALVSMRTEKAQMVLLKEIAQYLSKEVVPQRRLPLRKASTAGSLTTPVFKWITSFVSWRRKARRSKYMYGMSTNNMGLQMLLEKVPRSRKWRCLRSTQV